MKVMTAGCTVSALTTSGFRCCLVMHSSYTSVRPCMKLCSAVPHEAGQVTHMYCTVLPFKLN